MIRHLIPLTLLALTPFTGMAQQSTATPQTAARGFRWYLAPAVQVTTLNDETAAVTGLEFGWRVSPRLTLGLSSYRLANRVPADVPDALGADDVEFFYGGLIAEYALLRLSGMDLSARLLLGGGEAHWREDYWAPVPEDDHRDESHRTSFMAEPAVTVGYQAASWLRLACSGGYRFAGGGESNVLTQRDMEGFTASVGLRMGRF